MKEQPILFSGEMVRAILDGRKTQTRRVMKPQPKYLSDMPHDCDGWYWISPKKINGCEQVEAWKNDAVGIEWMRRHCPYGVPGDRLWLRETFCRCEDKICYKAGNPIFCSTQKGWTPSIYMPRWASRITLEITGVRAERLFDISDNDARSEGFESAMEFARLWDSLAKPGAKWADNPWVWIIEFRRVDNA